MREYHYQYAGCADRDYTTETHFGLFTLSDNTMVDIPQQYPFAGEWGYSTIESANIREEMPMPSCLDLVYLSIVEEKFYELSMPINDAEMEQFFRRIQESCEDEADAKIIVGMSPYGGVALWLGNRKKQLLLGWTKLPETEVSMSDFLPTQPSLSLHDYCLSYGLELVAPSPTNLFDKRMQQFCYRYLVLFENWDEEQELWQKPEKEEGGGEKSANQPELDFVDEALYDGTYDKLRDGGLLRHHNAGKPKKLVVKWHLKKSDYTAYFWFDEQDITTAFDRFYGVHRDTRTDFIIHIDPKKKKYELALYRYGLQKPVVINESAYQLIIFKSKFEYFRSENYNQPHGAWVW